MHTKVKVLDSFMHGRNFYARNDELVVPKSEADEMVDRGLVQIIGKADAGDDVPGDGAKMEPITSNKMEKAPANKAALKAKNK